MANWVGRATSVAVMLGTATAALAEKDRYDVGEAVKNFTLKVINPEEVGLPYLGIDRYYGPEAKEPKKAILLSFFATYCEPCKREMPYLAALYDTYSDKGLMILSVSIDKEEEKIDEVAALAKEAHVDFPIISDRFNIVAKRYFIEKLPCMYLVDGAGKVAMVKVGYNDDISRELLDNIRTAIGEPTSDPVPDALARYMVGQDGVNAPSSSEGEGDAEKAASTGATGVGKEGDARAAVEESGDQSKKKKKAKRKKRKKKRKKKQ